MTERVNGLTNTDQRADIYYNTVITTYTYAPTHTNTYNRHRILY